MLNRTNRTLSANLNRLNLGTRKLDQFASANIGNLTLRTAHVDHVVSVRAGSFEYPGFKFVAPPIMGPEPLKPAMPSMAGSSPGSPWPTTGRATWDQQGQPVALASQPVGTVVVRSGDGGTGRCVHLPSPRGSSSLSPSRSSLGRHCDPARLAGRSARATLVSAATP